MTTVIKEAKKEDVVATKLYLSGSQPIIRTEIAKEPVMAV